MLNHLISDRKEAILCHLSRLKGEENWGSDITTLSN
jgi:hypothetical protein